MTFSGASCLNARHLAPARPGELSALGIVARVRPLIDHRSRVGVISRLEYNHLD